MTLLATILTGEFVLSIADRRSCFQSGHNLVIKDEHFNKHIFFALPNMKGIISYCGYAEWTNRSGQIITTDKIIGDIFASCAIQGRKFGEAMADLAQSLDLECDWISEHYGGTPPFFTIHIAGFSDLFREPWIALMSDSEPTPAWNEDRTQYEFQPQGRFRIHFAVRARPCILWSGYVRHLPPDTQTNLSHLVNVKCRPFDIANFVVSRIRIASKKTAAVGTRVSAIIAPSEGSLDTGIWNYPTEDTLTVMPRMVWLNGTQWEPSEIKTDLSRFIPGKLHFYGLMYRSLLAGRVPRRLRRRLERWNPRHKTPTISEMMAYVLFGHHWDDTCANNPLAGSE